MCLVVTSHSRKTRHLFCHHHVTLVEARIINYIDLKRQFRKFNLRSMSWPDRNKSCYISFDQYRRSANTWMTSGTCGGVTGHNLSIQGVKCPCNPIFECLDWSPSKIDVFQFSPDLLLITRRRYTDKTSSHDKNNECIKRNRQC